MKELVKFEHVSKCYSNGVRALRGIDLTIKRGEFISVIGPSGAGKGTVYNEVVARRPNIKKSVSVTTRNPRPGEVEGVHYYFRTLEQYQEMIAKGEFLETASVYCNYYGTPKAPVLKMLADGNDVMFEIDTLGAEQIRKKYPKSITIFLMPPSFEELERRLRGRGTESEEAITRRLGLARSELSKYKLFDYIVFNDNVENAIEGVISIIDAEKSKTTRNETIIKKLLNQEN